ncbi:MAG: glycoside hydrolase family 25 protein [Ruminococcus sp.]|nr:glycoside hydrolase family 25 protein [Ruminococcus sp.]
MIKKKQVLSAVLSIAITVSVMSIPVYAESVPLNNYNTISSESKDRERNSVELSGEAFNVFDIYQAHLEAGNPTYNIYRESWGIDVSEHQKQIDWQAVKDSGIDFAIIRAGYGREVSQIDKYFIQNMKGAQSVGLDIGTYWYAYADSVEDAYKEADACYEIIKDYDFQYPVYYDIEERMYDNYSEAEVTAIIDAFCSRLQERGYYVGVYSYRSFLNKNVYDFIFDKYDVWVAEYGVSSPAFDHEYQMWQYTDSGKSQVNGIFTEGEALDLDRCYVDYPYIITGRKNDGSTQTPVEPPVETPVDPPSYIEQIIETRGIDVSAWNGEIDWGKVAAQNIDFAIIRAGYGKYETQKDYYFEQNYINAKAAGLDVGAYWYSYAQSPEEAVQEAQLFCKFVDGHKFEYPLYVELDESVCRGLSNSEATAVLNAFCSYVQSKGYFIGIMGSESFLKYRLDSSIFDKYAVWIFSYSDTAPVFSKFYGMWQYSSEGNIDGIHGNVLCNYCYDIYPQIMKDAHLNGY